jgi:DNA repair exonuclease SbcCD ATPase subunit
VGAKSSSPTFGRPYFLIIKSLRLDNFRSFNQAQLDFVPGQNYIFGQNWQGKSSVVDAIGFALFGVDIFPKKVAGTAVSSDHLVNEGSKHGSVELRFEHDGCEYSLHRSLPGRRVSLKKADQEVAVGIRTVAEKLVSLLGVDVKLFQNIFFSDQDELRKSLDFSPEERRVFIERLLGVEEWKQRIESFRATRRSLEGFLEDLTSGRLGAFLTHVEEMEVEVTSKQKELNELQSSIRAAKQNAPKDVQELRSAQDRSESAVAILQHKQLQIETKLGIEERVRDGIRNGRCPTCTQEIPPVLRTSRLNVLKRSLRAMNKQIAKIKRDLEKAEEALQEGDYDESFDAFVDLKEMKATFTATAKGLLTDERRLKRLRNQARTFGKKPEQVERTRAEMAFLSKLEEAIQQFRKSLRGRLVRQLALGTNDLLARFHDGDNDSAVKMDDDLNIAVKLHGRDVPIFNLSGAAKDILALALRYGLLRVAAGGINFLVLDEPTRHMDTSNCQRLKALFNDLFDRQLIVVTVNSEFSDATGRHFRVMKDDSLHSVVAESW